MDAFISEAFITYGISGSGGKGSGGGSGASGGNFGQLEFLAHSKIE